MPSVAVAVEHRARQLASVALARTIPAVFCSVISAILIFSEVPPNLIIVDGTWAGHLLELYALVTFGLIFKPNVYGLHRIALALGIIAWGGRGGGFLELVIELGRYDLIAAVAERVLIVILVVYYHDNEMERHARKGTLT